MPEDVETEASLLAEAGDPNPLGEAPLEGLEGVEVDEKALMATITEEVVADAMALRRRVFLALFPDSDSGLVGHAERELKLAGIGDPDASYDGWTAECVLDLMRVFASQGHSEGSAYMVLELFGLLGRYQVLSPITDNPETWMHIGEEIVGRDNQVWQSRRRHDAFSNDGGQTWYYLNDQQTNEAVNRTLHRMAPRDDPDKPDTAPAWVHEYSTDEGETWYPETGNTGQTGG